MEGRVAGRQMRDGGRDKEVGKCCMMCQGRGLNTGLVRGMRVRRGPGKEGQGRGVGVDGRWMGEVLKENEDRRIVECLKNLAECLQRMGDGCVMVDKSGIGFKERWR